MARKNAHQSREKNVAFPHREQSICVQWKIYKEKRRGKMNYRSGKIEPSTSNSEETFVTATKLKQVTCERETTLVTFSLSYTHLQQQQVWSQCDLAFAFSSLYFCVSLLPFLLSFSPFPLSLLLCLSFHPKFERKWKHGLPNNIIFAVKEKCNKQDNVF